MIMGLQLLLRYDLPMHLEFRPFLLALLVAAGAQLAALPVQAQAPDQAAADVQEAWPAEKKSAPRRYFFDDEILRPGRVPSTQEQDEPAVRYLLGVKASSGVDYFSGRKWDGSLRPVLAIEWRNLRFRTGGMGGLMGQGREESRENSGSGLESVLRAGKRSSLGLSLKLDRGRSLSHRNRELGGRKVRASLRARLRYTYHLSERWRTSAAISQDILARGGGAKADFWLSYEQALDARTTLGSGVGVAYGNGAFMRRNYGTHADVLRPFKPHSGFHEVSWALDISHALARHWVIFGGLHYSWLRGDARRSPLVHRDHGAMVSVGLAWRN